MLSTHLLIRLLLLVCVNIFMTEGNSDSEAEGTGRHHLLEGIQLPFHKFLHLHHDHTASSPAAAEEAPKLRFNGAGVRSVNFFGWDFKVYVAGFYHAAQHLIQDAETVFTAVNHYPMQLDFTFLRNVNQIKVTEAWQKQLAHSVEYTYDGFEKDREQFVQCFSL